MLYLVVKNIYEKFLFLPSLSRRDFDPILGCISDQPGHIITRVRHWLVLRQTDVKILEESRDEQEESVPGKGLTRADSPSSAKGEADVQVQIQFTILANESFWPEALRIAPQLFVIVDSKEAGYCQSSLGNVIPSYLGVLQRTVGNRTGDQCL